MRPSSPIRNQVGCVFVPVSDLSRAARWYSALFGLPPAEASHEGRIYDLPMQDGVALVLDSHRPVVNSSQPLAFFWTEDIQGARTFLRDLAVEVVREIEDIGSVSTLTFKDPDGNLLMVCQRNLFGKAGARS